MKNKVRCPCCGRESTIQVYFSGNHSTYTLLDEALHYIYCNDCKYDSREYGEFYSDIELNKYLDRS